MRPRREKLRITRIHDLLLSEGFDGSYDAVRRYAARWRQARRRDVMDAPAFIPLLFRPGEAYQFDWSHEDVKIAGKPMRVKVVHTPRPNTGEHLTILCQGRIKLLLPWLQNEGGMVLDFCHSTIAVHDLAYQCAMNEQQPPPADGPRVSLRQLRSDRKRLGYAISLLTLPGYEGVRRQDHA